MSAVNTDSIPPSHTNGVIEDGYDEDEKSKIRPADIDADMREMERRKRVELIMNSRLFREELERIIESQIKAGNSSAGLLQQISDMVGSKYSGINNHLFRSTSCAVPINDIRGVEAMGYAKGEKILRCKLAALFRLIDLYGWSQGIYNHVTARLSQQEEHFLVNPYGLLYSEVTASSLVKVDMQGNVIESGTTNFSVNVTGFQLHAAIYAARPDLKCIVHLHTPSVLAVSSLKDGLLPICQEAAVIGDISHHSYIGIPNEPEERDKIVRNLGPNNKVIFLTNHGALCCGQTIEETFFYAYNTVNACETQLKVLPLGRDNVVLLSDEIRKSMYDSARKIPENMSPPVSNVPSAAAATEKRWRIGGLEFEALMRMLDNAGFRTGYVYRQPLIKGELPRPRNDVEVPPAVSSLGYLLEEEELYKGQWKRAFGGKGNDRIRWLNSPNVYQKVEILETGTSDPKKITKWVDANNEEWVADGSPSHTSTPVKIENALQFVPKNTNPKEFKKLQQQIKENRRADKITSGPQSHILEGVSWEEAKKLQDANMSGTSDQVILVGAASKGIIQREYQHNATVYKTPYAKNPFDAITDEEIENYKKDITRKQRGDSYYDEDESDALSSSLPPSGKRQNTGITSETEDESLTHEMRVIQIETTTVPKASQAEVVLSDDKANRKLSKSQAATKAFIKDSYDYYSEELRKFIVRIWEVKKSRPILTTISIGGKSTLQPTLRSATHSYAEDSKRPSTNEMFKQIASELIMRFKQGSVFKQRSVRPAFLPIAAAAPEFHNVSFHSASFDCSDTEITTLIELPKSKRRFSRGSLESVHDFSSDPTTEDEEDPMSPEYELNRSSLMSLSSCIGQEYETPEESNEMTSSTTNTNVSDDTSFDDVTVICKDKSDGLELDIDEKGEFSDTSLSSELMQDDDDDEYIPWNTYESLNDVDEDYFVHKNDDTAKLDDECVTSFVDKPPSGPKFKPELAVIYEESTVSDGKCSLKSILDDNTIVAQPQCERSDTPDTYVIEEEPEIDHDVSTSVRKFVDSANALLDHLKNVKIDRNDSETVSAMAESISQIIFDPNEADSDAHTISDTSLISCLADSTEDLEVLKNDTSYDANDESERALDSGILMEDVATWSSEGDFTDMKLCSELVSADIAPSVGGRTSSGSDEADDTVWITQIEKIFDFDVDDLCLNRIFEDNDQIEVSEADTGQKDESLSDDLGVVVDTGSDDRSNEDIEQDDRVDSIVQKNIQADSVIDSGDQVVARTSPEPCTFRNDAENVHNDSYDMDNEHFDESASSVGSVHTSIFINEPSSDPDLPRETYINAGVTLQVPETQTETETVPDSVSVESETSSLPNEEHTSLDSQQNCTCHQYIVHSNCEICRYIEKTRTDDVSEVLKTTRTIDDFDFDVSDSIIIRILAAENELPCGVDDTFIEYKNIKDVFGESFLNDTNVLAISANDQSASPKDIENTASADESGTNFESSYICNDCNSQVDIVDQEFDEENTNRTTDQIIPSVDMMIDLMCQMIADDSAIKETPQENDSQIETEKFDADVTNDASVGDSTHYHQNETEHEPVDHHEELPSQLPETGIEQDQGGVVAEESNNCLSIDDSKAAGEGDDVNVSEIQIKLVESSEYIKDDEAEEKYSVYEPELSIELSGNTNDETVVEMDLKESTKAIEGDFATENESIPFIESNNVVFKPIESSESPENSDDVAIIENIADDESSKSAEPVENINYAESMENDAIHEPSNFIETPENDDNATSVENDDATESSEDVDSVENIDCDESTENDVIHEPSDCIESPENNEDAASVETDDAAKSSKSIDSTEIIDYAELTENDVIHEQSTCNELSENDDNVVSNENDDAPDLTENIDYAESTENDVIHESSNRIELFENDDDVISDENDDAWESSKSVDSTEIIDYTESTENNVIQEPSDYILSESVESTENIDHAEQAEDDVVHNPSNDIESPENNDDDASVENYVVSELSESMESIANTNDDGSVKNNIIDEFSESIESSESSNDDVYESYESAESNELDDVETAQNYVTEEPSESVDLVENSDGLIAAEDHISKSIDLVESNEIIDKVTAEDDLCNEPIENIESIENINDDFDAAEDGEISKSSESIKSNEYDVYDAVQNIFDDELGENVESMENTNDDVASAEDYVISEPFESVESNKYAESNENIDDVAAENTLDNELGENDESIENTNDDVASSKDYVISEASESIESTENIDENVVAAEDDVISESSESIDSNENVDYDNELGEKIESIENTDEEVVAAEDDVISESSKSIDSNENADYDPTENVLDNELGENVESIENANDDVASSEDYVISEASEFIESTENIDEDVVVAEDDIISESSESIDSNENVDYDNELGEKIESIENTNEDVVAAADDVISESSISEASESIESTENIDEDVVAAEDDVISESSESIDSNENADYDATENTFNNELGEYVESIENTNDGVASTEDYVISEPSELIESNEDVELTENIGDDVVAAEDDVISKSSESIESNENVEYIAGENILNNELEENAELIKNINDDVATAEDGVISKSSESIEWNHNVANVTAEIDLFNEPEENDESAENSDQFFSADNDVIEKSFKSVESIDIDPESSNHVELPKNNNEIIDNHSKSIENIDNAAISKIDLFKSPELVELVENNDVMKIVNDAIDKFSNFVELAENRDDSIAHSKDLVSALSTELETVPNHPGAENHLRIEPIAVQNDDLFAIAHQFTSATMSSDTNEAICSLLGYLNDKKYILKNITAAITNNSTEEVPADTSNEMNDNYVAISDADSSCQLHRSYVTVSDESIEKSESPVINDVDPSTRTSRSKSSPEQRTPARKNVRTSVRLTNRKSVKRTSPPKKESSTDDEKKPKLEHDVTEYSVKLKLHIEWDNKRSSSDSTSTKSSSFEDSLNCSESTSEGKRDKQENEHHYQGYERVTRLLTDFKTDYPKFISYEYFSPKVKIQRTQRKASTPRPKPARKSQSLESSPTGRYHRYCHITRDLNVDNKTTVTPKRTSPSVIKNVHRVSQRTVRKPFKCRNSSTTSSLKTSTPVLTATEFLTKESIVECLTSNTLSPIANSLEEFELIESLLTSCEK